MLAKLTSKNQLTLPKSVTADFGATEYFDVQAVNGQIVLTPVRIQRGDAVRAKLAALALGPADIAAAVSWGRRMAVDTGLQVAEPTPPYVLAAAQARPATEASAKPPAKARAKAPAKSPTKPATQPPTQRKRGV